MLMLLQLQKENSFFWEFQLAKIVPLKNVEERKTRHRFSQIHWNAFDAVLVKQIFSDFDSI